ncbi:MAG: hypothetical protein H7288_04210 [Kineosporiaceae bacterium]|nr:hypothetical protein [Aeromicrobium sp.]
MTELRLDTRIADAVSIVRSGVTGLRTGTAAAIGWLLLLAVVGAALTTVGDPAKSVLIYFVVWMASTALPGVLLWRVLARPTTLVQEIGFGSVLGIALLLLAWLPATLVHQPSLMWLWPAGLLVAFAAVPSLRRHWWPRRAPGQHAPGRWHAAMMVISGVAFLRLYAALQLLQLPPKPTSDIFQDVWYELSLTQALRRSVAIDDPSAAGVPLHYHWFSNAHVAATQQLSGLPVPEVVLHLWLVAMLLTLLFAVAAAAERILQGAGGDEIPPVRWWGGPLAALLVGALPAALFLGGPRLPAIDNGFVLSSTSGILALVVVLAFVGPVLDILHGLSGWGTWVLLLPLLALSAGTKPSLLPVVACGGLLVLIAQWVRTHKFPKVPAVLTLLPLLVIPVAAIAVIGSTGGSRLQLFQTLALDPAYTQATGVSVDLPGRGGWLAPGLAGGSGHVWAVSIGLFSLFVLTELPRLIGLLSPFSASLRRDPGTWWCTGVVGSGFSGLWVLAHPGYSQHYFWRIVIPLGIVLSVTMIVRLLPEPPRRALPAVVVVSFAGIATTLAFAVAEGVSLGTETVQHASYAVAGRIFPYAVAFVIITATILILRLLSARRGWTPLPAVALVACFVFAAGAGTAAFDVTRSLANARADHQLLSTESSRYVSGDEQWAALWLNEHSGANDVVATNVFCVRTQYRVGCRHVAFWVSALTGRQLFIGSWAYTEKNLTAYGNGGSVPYQRLPSPWPDRVALSLEAVRSPSPATMTVLQRRGVRWIFADRRATAVSPRLGEFATLSYSNADVMIYQLESRKGKQ